ncbi:MAG: hypothetical protein OIF32_05225, partial [Campylobacterales bacterium]|nr:hypothetical protein [Campylobacterales bacterium]
MFLNPEVLSLYILNTLFILFGSIAFYLSIKIYKNWNLNSTTKKQYTLEKQSFLTATIIKYIFIIKIPLFLYFIFTIDKLSNLITGAMCGAGVVDATDYGLYLFILKTLNLYLFGFWLVLHNKDIKKENLPYTKIKFQFFIGLFFLFFIEIALEFLMFSAIEIDKIVSCCGTLFSTSSETTISILFTLSNSIVVSIFYLNFLLIALSYFLKNKTLFQISNILFIPISIVSLILFFGTYIYELPTHHCPFCYLQKDYNYVGYFIYIFLFLGTFFGILKRLKISIIFNLLFVLIATYYPLT